MPSRTNRKQSGALAERALPLCREHLSTREQNEKKFGQWETLPNGGRRYWYELTGRNGWKARYLKEVDAREKTARFWQEIYNAAGQLVETHQKYPADTGHRKVTP